MQYCSRTVAQILRSFHASFSSEISSLFPLFVLFTSGVHGVAFQRCGCALVHPKLLTQEEQELELTPTSLNPSLLYYFRLGTSHPRYQPAQFAGRPPDYLFLRWARTTARVSAPHCAGATLPDAQKDENSSFWTFCAGPRIPSQTGGGAMVAEV